MPSHRGNRRSRRLKNEINVVPYIDVMLVLLVIFMVTAPMITPGQINLPSVGTATSVPAKPIEVQIAANGDLSIRLREPGSTYRPTTAQNLVAEVQSMSSADTPVVIAADGHVPYQDVLKVMDQLRSSGVARLGLLVDQSASTNTPKQ